MADKKNETPEKPIVEGVSNTILLGFMDLLTLRFLRESREEAEKEKQNG